MDQLVQDDMMLLAGIEPRERDDLLQVERVVMKISGGDETAGRWKPDRAADAKGRRAKRLRSLPEQGDGVRSVVEGGGIQ